MSIYPPKDIRPGQAAGPDLQFWNLCSLHHHKAPFSWHTQGSVGELSVKLCDPLSPRPEYQGDYLRHLLRFYFFLRWWSMKRSYPCVQENNEPLFPPTYPGWLSQACRRCVPHCSPTRSWLLLSLSPSTEDGAGARGLLGYSLRSWSDSQKLSHPATPWFLSTCSACSTTVCFLQLQHVLPAERAYSFHHSLRSAPSPVTLLALSLTYLRLAHS